MEGAGLPHLDCISACVAAAAAAAFWAALADVPCGERLSCGGGLLWGRYGCEFEFCRWACCCCCCCLKRDRLKKRPRMAFRFPFRISACQGGGQEVMTVSGQVPTSECSS